MMQDNIVETTAQVEAEFISGIIGQGFLHRESQQRLGMSTALGSESPGLLPP